MTLHYPTAPGNATVVHVGKWDIGEMPTLTACKTIFSDEPRSASHLLLTIRYWQWTTSSFSPGWERWCSLCNISVLFQKKKNSRNQGENDTERGRVRRASSSSCNCWFMQNTATSYFVLKLKWNTEWLFHIKAFLFCKFLPWPIKNLKK